MGRLNLCFAATTILILLFSSVPGICDEEQSDEIHDPMQWLTDGDLSGEIGWRYRREVNSGEEENVFQFQLNLDYEAELSDSWNWAIGLRTGTSGRPTRGWVDEDMFFEENHLYLRPWTLTHTGNLSGCRIKTTFGAFEYPFEQSGIIFDGDVIRQGVSQEYSFDLNGDDLDLGCLAQYLQNGDIHGDTWAIAGNASMCFRNGRSSRTTIQLSYIDFLNVDTIGQAIFEERLNVGGHAPDIGTTNYITEGGDLQSDFNILFLKVKHEWGRQSDWPMAIWGEYINNSGASEGCGNDGYILGIDMGNRNNAGDISLGLSYLRLEDDSTLELYNRGKFGTNVKGWTADLRYYLTDDLVLRLDNFWLKTNSPREDIEFFKNRTMQIGLVYQF